MLKINLKLKFIIIVSLIFIISIIVIFLIANKNNNSTQEVPIDLKTINYNKTPNNTEVVENNVEKFIVQNLENNYFLLALKPADIFNTEYSSFFNSYPALKITINLKRLQSFPTPYYFIFNQSNKTFVNEDNPYKAFIKTKQNAEVIWFMIEDDTMWFTKDNHKTVKKVKINETDKSVIFKGINLDYLADNRYITSSFDYSEGFYYFNIIEIDLSRKDIILKVIKQDKISFVFNELDVFKQNTRTVNYQYSQIPTFLTISSQTKLGLIQTPRGMTYYLLDLKPDEKNSDYKLIDGLPGGISVSDTVTACKTENQKCYSYDNSSKILYIFKQGKIIKQFSLFLSGFDTLDTSKAMSLIDLNNLIRVEQNGNGVFLNTNNGWKALYIDTE
jgi:hypothetical protein